MFVVVVIIIIIIILKCWLLLKFTYLLFATVVLNDY